MRSVGRAMVAVCVAVAAVFVVTVSAQKGKPARTPTYVWTLQVVGESEGPTIIGGPTTSSLGTDVTYDPAINPEVQVFALPSGADNVWNRFRLEIVNGNPMLPRTAPAPDPSSWISFRDIAMASDGDRIGGWGPYSSQANSLGPVPEDTGWFWPFRDWQVNPQGQPDYQAAFLNWWGPHPRQYYQSVSLLVAFRGDSFLNLMQDDGPVTVYPNAYLAVYSKRDCNDPLAVGTGFAGGELYPTTPATLNRTGENQWRLDIKQPVVMIEYGYQPVTRTVGKKQVTGCGDYSAGGWQTTPITYHLLVTRYIS